MLVLRFNLYLIISEKVVPKGKDLTTRTLIQNLINKWCGEIVLRIGTIQITEISTYADRSLLLVNRNGCFPRIHCTQALSNRLSIGISLNLVFNNARVNTWHFVVRPRKNITEFLK